MDGGAAERELALLTVAQTGDEEAFLGLTAPHRRALHVHCYRLLGSLHDADDALQETLLRAWRGLPRFEPRAPLSAWLHRIATNVSLRMIEQRRDPAAPPDAHLQPYPEDYLEELPTDDPGPEERATERESVALAFVAAMQLLPPKQRAVLVLRDALDWPARDVADLLDDTVPAVNSALQRARSRLAREQEAGTLARLHAPASVNIEASVMRSFQEAWAAVDIPRIVALLTDAAVLTMPPIDVRIEGAAAVGEFFATEPLAGHIERIALVPTRANGQPGFACYADEHATGKHNAYGIMIFALEGDRIAGITGFPEDTALFERLGVPLSL
jgi:RNA polymerase sigma-70 factor, ECF subfamily